MYNHTCIYRGHNFLIKNVRFVCLMYCALKMPIVKKNYIKAPKQHSYAMVN